MEHVYKSLTNLTRESSQDDTEYDYDSSSPYLRDESAHSYDTSYEQPSDDNLSMYNSACELPETVDFKDWFLEFANKGADKSAPINETVDDISIKSKSRRMLEAIDWINRNYKMETSILYYSRYKRNAMFEPIPFNLFLEYI